MSEIPTQPPKAAGVRNITQVHDNPDYGRGELFLGRWSCIVGVLIAVGGCVAFVVGLLQ
jgi:hypothetical protein